MADPIYGTGSGDLVVGWAPESTAGTPVAAAHFFAPDIGSVQSDFNPNRMPVDVATGNPATTIALIDRNGQETWAFTHGLYPTIGTDFLAQMGLTASGITAPKPTTLTESYGPKAVQYPGCRMLSWKLTSDPANGAVYAASGRGTARPPDPIGPLAAPAMASEDPFAHNNLGAVTLLTGVANQADVTKVEITVNLIHAGGQGNAGVPLENILRFARYTITFSLTLFLNEVTINEWIAMKKAGGTLGPLSMAWSNGTHSLALNIPNAKYLNGPITAPKDGLDLVTFSGHAQRIDNVNPLMTLVTS